MLATDGSTARVFNNAGGIVDISGATTGISVGSIEGAGDILLRSKRLTLGSTNMASADISGVIRDGGFNGGTGGTLIKAGTGSLILSGANTYTGATNVNGGTLSVNGSIASSSLITVNAGATLGGNGTVGNTTINGGTLAPGNSIGTLDGARQSRLHGGGELHGRGFAREPTAPTSPAPRRWPATVAATFAPGTMSKAIHDPVCRRRRQRHVQRLANSDLPANSNRA